MSRGTMTWLTAVHADRLQALAATDPSDVRVQSVDAACWRVVDAAAAWDNPGMLLGFVERTASGFECTLMATLHDRERVTTLDAAQEYFMHACGTARGLV